MEGAALWARFDAERDLAQAHLTASFTRAKKLEPLEHYLPTRRERSSGGMLERLQDIAAATEHLG